MAKLNRLSAKQSAAMIEALFQKVIGASAEEMGRGVEHIDPFIREAAHAFGEMEEMLRDYGQWKSVPSHPATSNNLAKCHNLLTGNNATNWHKSVDLVSNLYRGQQLWQLAA